jgi:hypothetical protein
MKAFERVLLFDVKTNVDQLRTEAFRWWADFRSAVPRNLDPWLTSAISMHL